MIGQQATVFWTYMTMLYIRAWYKALPDGWNLKYDRETDEQS
jgi:hypothetical protein